MKQSEIKELSVADLREELDKTRQELSNLKMTHAISPLENPMQIRVARKAIARLATEITKRELD
ncbi:50S ribosomal protein L29 [Psychroflexus maritimus]|uniref:Large ribosomal subunit protein uL29 n=1 Tax=Psychroflexus maritimus TaxID=2714865 RepID=A0A967ADN6_9FLAO|nr:50S ribosomal protein L29 [Psychroflexus maritimus]NGZ90347.1 50S ribosomal protein L29 [Psychroflexus maritimus]